VDCRAYGRNFQAIYAYLSSHNIEYYKFQKYGHIPHNYRTVNEPSMKENNDVRYQKVWRRKEKKEEKVNEEHVP
jgi:hypothetical protein